MEESEAPNVDADSARAQLPSSIQIHIHIDGTTARFDREPARTSQVDGITQVNTNTTGNSARERSETMEELDMSEIREKLKNAETQQRELQAGNKALQQEVEKLRAHHETAVSIAEEIRNLKQERDSLKKQLAEGKESLEKLDNAVGSNLEARFYKCQFELANNKMQNQQEMAIKLGAAQEENAGLKAHIERLNEQHAECGFEPLEPSHATVKRKAMDALYHPGTRSVKKMRLAEDTHLDLEGFRTGEACELSGNVNNEVLRVAARAGLLNFQHFSTGPNGTLGLTELGAKKVAISEGFRSCLEALEIWETESAELTNKARKLTSKGGF